MAVIDAAALAVETELSSEVATHLRAVCTGDRRTVREPDAPDDSEV